MRQQSASLILATALLASVTASFAAEQPGQILDPLRLGGSEVDSSRFGDIKEPTDSLGSPPVKMLKSKELSPGTVDIDAKPGVDPKRFGKTADEAYGAYQRGLYVTAYHLALPRAEKGDAAAQTLVAEILTRGMGMKVDPQAAADWYGKAAAQGVPEAQFQYALLQLDGKYAGKDADAAMKLMKAAADQGNPLAEFNLAQLYVKQDDSDAGIAKAIPYFESAAVTGLPDAQYAMAQVFANGAGGKKQDLGAARRFLTLAAKQGFDTAQLDLGSWMVSGRGGDRNVDEGFTWLRRAAMSGNVAAMNRLAKLYMNGIGTDPNSIDAAAWYFLARRAGLNDVEMTDFLAGLTDDQTKKALERANRLR